MDTDNVKDQECEDVNKESREKAPPSRSDDEKKQAAREDPARKTTKRKSLDADRRRAASRNFFKLARGSILYCLSALSIIYGIAQIVGPVLAESNVLGQTLPCVGVLNLYELALLGVLLLIVLWRNVTDDAVFLMVLIALLMIASGITMDTIANDGPGVAVFVGMVSLVIAGAKLWVMRRYISLRLERLLLVGAVVLLAWNFSMSPLMAFVVRQARERAIAVRNAWLIGWLAMLAGGVLMLLHATGTATGGARSREKKTPFLRTPGMAWVFALILLSAANVHQCALSFLFDVHFSFGDFLPMIAIGSLLSLELMRSYGKKFGQEEIVVALLPLAAVLFAVLSGSFVEGFSYGVGLLWYPPVVLGVTGIAILWISLRNGWQKLLYAVLAYALGIVLTAGVTPADPNALNWELFGCALGVTLFVMGIILGNVNLAMRGVAVLSLTCGLSDAVRAFARRQDLPIFGVMGLVAGFGTVTVYLLFCKKLPRGLAVLGAAVLSLSTMICFGRAGGSLALYYPAASGAVIAFLGGMVWSRTRDLLVTTVLCLPLVRGIYVAFKEMRGWRYVILSFVLLAAGTLLSVRKGRVNKAASSKGGLASQSKAAVSIRRSAGTK